MTPVPKPEHIRAFLIINPGARNGTRLNDLLQAEDYLRSQGWEVTHGHSQYPGHTRALARQAVEEGYNAVIVAGGDGSIGHAADGLAGTDVALGIIPAGTGNILARDLGLPLPSPFMPNSFLEAARILAHADWYRVDVGVMQDSKDHTHRFLNWCGTGLDAAITLKVEYNLEEKRRWGMAAYVLPTVQTALNYQPPQWQIILDEKEQVEGPFYLVVINNVQLYAAFLRLAPNAYMDDGWLDIALIQAQNFQEFLRIMSHILVFKRPGEQEVLVRRIRSAKIEASPDQPVHLDGDPYTRTPIHVWVEHQNLILMVPSGPRLPRHLLRDAAPIAETVSEEEQHIWSL
ncbi:MAG: diacylglycerol kinase family lipid kinase [Chloroflexi bacterium]|nr:diacylglycerol kinase family lipid kinase [Chloroflexota bacterium]